MKFKILIATFALIALPFETDAGSRSRSQQQANCSQSFQRVIIQEEPLRTEIQTTVINNLVGIPVPVTYSQPIAAQGSTIFGYSATAQAYGQLDMALLYNQAARLTDQAQQLAGQAATDFATLVQAEGQNRAEVARIIAQGQSARQALTAASGFQPQQIQQNTMAFRVTQGADGKLSIETIEATKTTHDPQNFELSGAQGIIQNVSDLLKQRCVSCHGNAKVTGDLNLELPITDAQQIAILKRITTDDLTKRMPRGPDDTAGQKLNIDELRLLFNAMSSP